MVPRKPKLVAAASVLAVGLALAWPWRRDESLPPRVLPIAGQTTSFGSVPPPPASAIPSAATSISATTIGTTSASLPSSPAVALPQTLTAAKPITSLPEITPPFGATPSPEPESPITERIHVVHPGDSLERLARRYLGDEARAIEIFDLNRQLLENPHLLPIGAELKIPAGAEPPTSDSVL